MNATQLSRYKADCRKAKKLLQDDPDISCVSERNGELVATIRYPEAMRTVGKKYEYLAYYTLDGTLIRRSKKMCGPIWRGGGKSEAYKRRSQQLGNL